MKVEQKQFFQEIKPVEPEPNPCIALYGVGPEGTYCQSCVHFYFRQRTIKYPKCKLRTYSRSAATDHRFHWHTCGRYKSNTIEDSE